MDGFATWTVQELSRLLIVTAPRTHSKESPMQLRHSLVNYWRSERGVVGAIADDPCLIGSRSARREAHRKLLPKLNSDTETGPG
jgi:hypothetical protein